MDEVDEAVGEENEDWKLEIVVEVEGRFIWSVIEFCVAFDFGGETCGC